LGSQPGGAGCTLCCRRPCWPRPPRAKTVCAPRARRPGPAAGCGARQRRPASCRGSSLLPAQLACTCIAVPAPPPLCSLSTLSLRPISKVLMQQTVSGSKPPLTRAPCPPLAQERTKLVSPSSGLLCLPRYSVAVSARHYFAWQSPVHRMQAMGAPALKQRLCTPASTCPAPRAQPSAFTPCPRRTAGRRPPTHLPM